MDQPLIQHVDSVGVCRFMQVQWVDVHANDVDRHLLSPQLARQRLSQYGKQAFRIDLPVPTEGMPKVRLDDHSHLVDQTGSWKVTSVFIVAALDLSGPSLGGDEIRWRWLTSAPDAICEQ